MDRSFTIIIPARYSSSRFPGKPLARILGKPMIQRVYESCKLVDKVNDIYVATDDMRIFDVVTSFGGKALITSDKHNCGTDRLAECVDILNLVNDEVVLNIQGDEPLIRKEMVNDLISCFEVPEVYMGTLKKRIVEHDELDNPNVVKVITDLNDNAIYFSRYCVPYERDGKETVHYKHVGVYGYTVKFLKQFSMMNKTSLEIAESLEQLRVIQNGYKIKVKETNFQTVGVDTPEQLKQVEKMLGGNNE